MSRRSALPISTASVCRLRNNDHGACVTSCWLTRLASCGGLPRIRHKVSLTRSSLVRVDSRGHPGVGADLGVGGSQLPLI
jgi:hypothetical protein